MKRAHAVRSRVVEALQRLRFDKRDKLPIPLHEPNEVIQTITAKHGQYRAILIIVGRTCWVADRLPSLYGFPRGFHCSGLGCPAYACGFPACRCR